MNVAIIGILVLLLFLGALAAVVVAVLGTRSGRTPAGE